MCFRCAAFELRVPAVHGFFVHPGRTKHLDPRLLIDLCGEFSTGLHAQHFPEQLLPALQLTHFFSKFPHAALQYALVCFLSCRKYAADIVNRKSGLTEAANRRQSLLIFLGINAITCGVAD